MHGPADAPPRQAAGLTRAAPKHVLVPCEHGEFLIGDTPAFTIDRERDALGFTDNVSLEHPATLPLGPDRLAALGPKDEWLTVPASCVDELNRYQIRKAKERVFMRTGSGLQAFVRAEHPPGRLG